VIIFSAFCCIWCILIILMAFNLQKFIVVDICELTVCLKKKRNRNPLVGKQFFILSFLLWNWKPKSCVPWFWKHLNNSSCSYISDSLYFAEAKHICYIKWVVARFFNSHLCCFNPLDAYWQIMFARVENYLLFLCWCIMKCHFRSFTVGNLFLRVSRNTHFFFCFLHLYLDFFGFRKTCCCTHCIFYISHVLCLIHIMVWSIY
jgi:hypothetical protein